MAVLGVRSGRLRTKKYFMSTIEFIQIHGYSHELETGIDREGT